MSNGINAYISVSFIKNNLLNKYNNDIGAFFIFKVILLFYLVMHRQKYA